MGWVGMRQGGPGWLPGKKDSASSKIEFYDNKFIETNDTKIIQGKELVNKFIGRSSIRIVPQIDRFGDRTKIELDQDRPDSYIENDTRFINDIFDFIEQFYGTINKSIFD
jgi:hypothetical protein